MITNDWGTGYTASLQMANAGAPTTAWSAVVDLGGSTVSNAWNATTATAGGQLTASNVSYNAAIPSTTTDVWGFQGAGSGRPSLVSLSINGGSAPPPPPPTDAGGGGPTSAPLPSFATTSTCDNFGTIFSSGNVYFVMNNVFNDASGSQCITASGSGFTVTSANHTIATNGAPAAYTAFVRGCHFGTCTTGSNLPKQVSTITSVPSSFAVTPAGNAWDAAYDIWFDHTTNTTSRNNGLEMMIWLDSTGVQPIGGQVDTATIAGATWQVWYSASASPPVISYRRTPVTTAMATFDIKLFMADAMARNAATGTRPVPSGGSPALNPAWFLTSVQAGFELWNGGAHAAAASFTAQVQ
ncbi:MAG TPA: cellulose binding domain-containing protein [Kofleriaceae bacterium]|nr:cellulose binding domain-containing protein [Kofleriaceae bacterium]